MRLGRQRCITVTAVRRIVRRTAAYGLLRCSPEAAPNTRHLSTRGCSIQLANALTAADGVKLLIWEGQLLDLQLREAGAQVRGAPRHDALMGRPSLSPCFA